MSNERVKVLRGKEVLQDNPGFGVPAHVGRAGDLFLDPELPSTGLRISDGATPGGVPVGSSGYNVGQFWDYGAYANSGNVAINLTKKYHWLVDLGVGNHYTLADGVDGQELVFMPCYGLMYAGVEQSDIYVDHIKHFVDAGPSSRWQPDSLIVRLFSHSVVSNAQAMVKALYMNGSWHFDANIEIIDGF